MLIKYPLILSKYQQISIIILTCVFVGVNVHQAKALTANEVMNKMNSDQRFGYISGVVEGLAYSRWLRDKPDRDGMDCIFNWYLKGKGRDWNNVSSWFSRHPDKPVGALLYVLIKKECGA